MKTLKQLREEWVECNILYCGEGLEAIEKEIAKRKRQVLRKLMSQLNSLEVKLTDYVSMQATNAEYELDSEFAKYEKARKKLVDTLKELL